MPTKRNKNNKKSVLDIDISIGGINLTQKAILAKHLSVMQKSGLAISESLSILEESARGKMKKVIGGIRMSVESGNSLSSSFARYPKIFSGLFISSIYAGETSGTLDKNLEILAEQLEKEKELTSKIKGAMLYPMVVLAAAFILGMALSFLVLPKIIPLFEGLKTDLPATTRGLMKFSHFVNEQGAALFIGIVIFIAFMYWLLKRKFTKPAIHLLFLRIPLIKRIVRNTNIARFTRTLGTLLKSGLSIDEALEVTRNTLGNYYYSSSIKEVSLRVGKGAKLSESLKHYDDIFPIMVTRMIIVGEESGKIEETLIYLADFYEAEVDNATKSLSTAIEPMLLIFIGLVVGFLALSIITPIYNITGNIRR